MVSLALGNSFVSFPSPQVSLIKFSVDRLGNTKTQETFPDNYFGNKTPIPPKDKSPSLPHS
jgi:hypothetical protein